MIEILIGFVSGIVSGTGMGGGTILILLLMITRNMDQHLAGATNLIFFVPMSIATIIINLKQKYIDLKVGTWVIVFGVIGAVIGAKISVNMDVGILKKCFGVFLGAIAIKEIYSLLKEYITNKKRHNSNINEN